MTGRSMLPGAIALSLGAAACGPVPEPDGTPGALRTGGFVYCDPSGRCGYSDPLPGGIAVGSVFELEFDGDSNAVLVSANEDRLRVVKPGVGSTEFRAVAAGPATVEARDSSDNEFIDTITLTLVRAARLRPEVCARAFNAITKLDQTFDPSFCAGDDVGESGVTVSRGASLAPTVCVVPVDAAGTALSGLLAGTFSVSGAAQLEMHVDAKARCVTIGGLTLGDAAVTVAAGEFLSTFTVQVVP